MISISLPLPPTGLRAPGSPASAAPPGDFALALADMLTIAGAETSPAVLPAAPAGRQLAAVPGKSLPDAAAAAVPIGTTDDDDVAPPAPEAAVPTPAAPSAAPSIVAIEKAPAAGVREDAPSRDRTHSRRKEALAALPLPIPAVIAPPAHATAISEAPVTALGTAGESRPAAKPLAAIAPDQSSVSVPATGPAAPDQAPAETIAVPPAKRSNGAVTASVPTTARGNGEATTQGAPIAPSPSQTVPPRPARFQDARVDADAPTRPAAAPVIADAEPLAPKRLKQPGTTTTASAANAAVAPSQAPAQAAPAIAAPMIGAAPTHELARGAAGAPRGGAYEHAIAAQPAGIVVAPVPQIVRRREPAPVGHGEMPHRAAATRVSSDAAPARAENLETAPPGLTRAILADRPAPTAGARSGSSPIQGDAPAPIGTAGTVAEAVDRRVPAAPGSGPEARRAQASPAAAQPVLPDAAPATGVRDSAVSMTPVTVTRAPAPLDPQPAPAMPLADAPAPRAQHLRQGGADGVTPAPVQPATPGPRPIALAPLPPAVAPVAAMFGAAQPLGPRAPKPVERAEASAAIAGTLATAHTAAPIQPVAEAQRTLLDMRRDDWTQKLIDRIETIRDAANATDTRIKLMPDALGKIDVSMRKDGDTVHVAFTADVPATRAMLADAQPRLAELAQQRGLRLGQASVDAGTSGDGQQRQAPAPSLPTRPIRAAERDEALTETGRVA